MDRREYGGGLSTYLDIAGGRVMYISHMTRYKVTTKLANPHSVFNINEP